MSFLDIQMVNSSHVFLGLEVTVDLPAERFTKLQYLLSAPSLHIRLPKGGNALPKLRTSTPPRVCFVAIIHVEDLQTDRLEMGLWDR